MGKKWHENRHGNGHENRHGNGHRNGHRNGHGNLRLKKMDMERCDFYLENKGWILEGRFICEKAKNMALIILSPFLSEYISLNKIQHPLPTANSPL